MSLMATSLMLSGEKGKRDWQMYESEIKINSIISRVIELLRNHAVPSDDQIY